jgi:hypothetical protein
MAAYRESAGGLGARIREHGWTLAPWALVGVAMIVVPLSLWMIGGDGREGAVLTDAFVIVPIVGALLLAVTWPVRRNRVVTYEHGLVHRWRGQETTLRYDRIVSLRSDVTRSNGRNVPAQRLVVTSDDGTRIVVTHGFADASALIALVEQRSFSSRLAHWSQVIASGDKVGFGELVLDREGLKYPLHPKIPIADLASLERYDHLGEPRVALHTTYAARCITVPARAVPDADVLAELIRQARA